MKFFDGFGAEVTVDVEGWSRRVEELEVEKSLVLAENWMLIQKVRMLEEKIRELEEKIKELENVSVPEIDEGLIPFSSSDDNWSFMEPAETEEE